MTITTEIKIIKAYGKVRQDRKAVAIQFKNKEEYIMAYPHYRFTWLPKYEELKEIMDKLKQVELLNLEVGVKK